MTDKHKTLHGKGVMASLTVNHLPDSLKFFEAFGFEVQDKWEHEGKLLGYMLKAGDVMLGINQDDGKKGHDRVKGAGMSLYIEVDNDIDQLAERAKAAGIKLKSEPQDTDWGSRAFAVTEPTGFALTFTSPQK